ncbi:L10-interacting MYB domain-containing protein-like [Syzygium oleosum]|uniref:L10-interacting MYB domain-containing protein-like n=1 Tax=Syzygium oleosum TaxID=219896 RepID=UPI0024BBC1DD|nr:L10-interacting MYB domain-containing protein-like [Syzygium oleosum]XP_056166311.1 L10-interacting MYB domain-containing protein-like [Syzygium oleosum]
MASSSKEKAFWSSEDVETFCKLCIEQIEKGNRPASNKRDGWVVIISKFEELTGKKYDKNKMKSKWDNLKEEWKRWRSLLYNETGLGWDSRKKTIDASDEWWESKIQVNPKFKAFRMKGIHPDLGEKLDMMFRDTVATGGVTWNPGQGLCINNDVEVTQPGMDDVAGSTDENLEGHVDETIGEPIGAQSRKRAAQTSTRQARGKKDKKLSTREELGTQINRLVAAVESRSNATATSQATTNVVGPYKDLIDILDTIPEIVEDEMLYHFAISHLKEKIDNRQVFMSLKDDAKKVKYLKYEFGKESRLHR